MTSTTADLRNPLFQQDLFHCILDCLAALEASPKQFRESRQAPPSPSEWVTIRRYSHRIKELTIGPLGRFSLFFLRSTSLHPSLLVPNLRVLRWRLGISTKTRPFLSTIITQQLLSPSLISLNVTLSSVDDAILQSFLANYPFPCSNLKSVVIRVTGREQTSRTAIGTLSRAIPHHEHLECLDVSVPIDDVALTHVTVSQKLKKLALVLDPDKSNLHQVCIPSDIIPFRNVEELSLEVWDLCFVTTLLRTQDQMFRSFVLRHRFPPTIDAVFTFFTALASRQRMRSIQSIRLMPVMSGYAGVEEYHFTPGEFDALAMDYQISYDTLRPLTFLCHLRELVVDVGRWFSIDDDDLVSLARNWPLLQVLHLNCRKFVRGHPWRSAKHVTFKGLSSFLECCPDLRDVRLPLDAREVPHNTGGVFCNTAVRYIQFPSSPTVMLVWWKKP
ncbi:hypothetical protein J3R83DRAFT_9706 [Lanmaoa asiatica]|nr:hypothetical protein J3R83DRAFT_9706 [Lanmaoa asiatica]